MTRRPALVAVLSLAVLPVLGAPDDAGAQQFGSQVAFLEGRVLVSEPALQGRPAIIRIYERDGDAWEETGQITAPAHEGGDFFGRFVAMDEGSFIVGGTLFEDSRGAVWVYDRNGSELELRQVIQPEDTTEEDSFGRFGVLYEDLLFVSALGYEDQGAVWVFERDESGTFEQRARIQPDDMVEAEFFGWSLAYNGERLIVGSFAGEPGTGAAYVFLRDGDDWDQEARLTLSQQEAAEADVGQPGVPGAGAIAVGWFQGMALLGLPGRDNTEGAVITWSRQPATGSWIRGAILSAFDRAPGAYFGHAYYEIDGELWIAAPGAGLGGSVYRFAYDADAGIFEGATKFLNTLDPDQGDGFGSSVAVAGDLMVVGQPGDDNGMGSAIIMERDGDGWSSQAKLFIPSDDQGAPRVAGDEVRCNENGQADIYGCFQVDLLSFLPTEDIGGGRGTQTNDVWGWTDPESGREYALVGRSDGTAFVDVTDPVNPVYVGNLPRTPGSQSSVWRDLEVYQNYVFVVADGAGRHGVQIFDLRQLRDVQDPPERFEADLIYRGVASAHTISVNTATGFAYAMGANGGGDTCGGGLHMIDVRTPLEPTFVGCFQDESTGRAGTGYSHDALCFNYNGPDTEHVGKEICIGSNEDAISIADVTDKANPIALSAASYPFVAYAHQGWITEDHRYFYLGDELDEGQAGSGGAPEMTGTRTLIWDLQDLDDPIMVQEHFGTTFTTDHNMYIKGDLLYQSNYESGLRILNISDPLNPVEVGFLDTVPDRESDRMNGSWSNYPFFESGTIAVTSRGEGIFFVRHRPQELIP